MLDDEARKAELPIEPSAGGEALVEGSSKPGSNGSGPHGSDTQVPEPLLSHPSEPEFAPLEPPLLEPIEPPQHAAIEEPMAPTIDPPAPPTYAEPPPHESAKPPRARRDPLPWLFGMFIILLIGAVVYLWRHPINGLTASAPPDDRVVALQDQMAALQQRLTAIEQRPAPAPPPPPPDPAALVAPLEQRLTPLEQRLTPLEDRLKVLEQRPVVAPANDKPNTPAELAAIRDLNAKLDALSKQQTQISTTQSAATAALAARLDAEQKTIAGLTAQSGQISALASRVETEEHQLSALSAQSGQISALSTRVEAEERQLGALSAQTGQVAMLAGRLDAQEKQLGTLAGQAGQISSVAGRLEAQEKQVGVLAGETGKINGVAERAARTARIQAATAALEAGRPLGDLPDAPPALARFKTVAPPTEAALRLAFPAVAAAAQASSRPDTAKLPFWEAVQTRAQELITVRRGDQVIVGDPAAGVIARARHALDAGDLAGAVSVLHELTGNPAAGFAEWQGQAQALLDARAALTTMAAHA